MRSPAVDLRNPFESSLLLMLQVRYSATSIQMTCRLVQAYGEARSGAQELRSIPYVFRRVSGDIVFSDH